MENKRSRQRASNLIPSTLHTPEKRTQPDKGILNAIRTDGTQSGFRDTHPHAPVRAINGNFGRGILRAGVIEERLEAVSGDESRAAAFGDGCVHACEARARGVGLGAFGEFVADNYHGWSGGSAGMESKGRGEGEEGGQGDDLLGVEVGE